jgi:hypothetical protein
VVLKNNHIHNNGIGVINAPGNNLTTFTTSILRNNNIEDNTCGVVTSSLGTNASTPTTTDCGAATAASGINRQAVVQIYGNGINANSFGVFARGSTATAEIANNEITASDSFALRRVDSATIRTTIPATNVISGNAATDTTNATVALTKRNAKRFR